MRSVSYDFFLDVEKNNTTHRWINKYAGTWTEGARIFDSDIIVYRYADLLMFDAEIKNDQNQKDAAVDAINQVAQRAYGRTNFYPKTLSKEEVDAVLLREREKEFCAEGQTLVGFYSSRRGLQRGAESCRPGEREEHSAVADQQYGDEQEPEPDSEPR